MHSELNAQLAFHLTGVRSAAEVAPMESLALRPALLSGYRDLTALRYDFPLVLAEGASCAAFAQPLSRLVDQALEKAALPGAEGERLRAQALRREREIRADLARGKGGRLSSLWNVPPALGTDGEVVDCDAAFPLRFVKCAWNSVQAAKARRFHQEAEKLVVQLGAILAADFVQSDEGRSAPRLAAALGSQDDSFDAEAMSRLLARALPERRLPQSRHRRLRSLLSVLKAQRFYARVPESEPVAGAKPFGFVFESCAAALQAIRERQLPLIELAKALATARLEAAGEYVEARHDALFEAFAENAVSPLLAPDYLVCINARNLQAADNAGLAELLASGMPVKILVQHDDILERSSVGQGGPAFGAHARLLAGMALGLNDVYVLQSSASNLYPMRERVLKGLDYPGAALFSIFSGATESVGVPPYLFAAAAMESRAFPAFTYDPSAPGDRAERFSLENNPQPGADWPRHRLTYEDPAHQRIEEDLPFTLADLAACDARYAGYFACVPRERTNGQVPSLFMADKDDVLQKVIVAEPLMREAARCLDAWHALQAYGKRAAPPAPAVENPQPAAKQPPAAEAPKATAAPAPATEPEKASPASDAPYIETPRCTTCEECLKINNRLFLYDGNKQAYIADVKAGTYRELVEAAEACQVSIIHPGKPLNADEPGLDELLKRAEPFL